MQCSERRRVSERKRERERERERERVSEWASEWYIYIYIERERERERRERETRERESERDVGGGISRDGDVMEEGYFYLGYFSDITRVMFAGRWCANLSLIIRNIISLQPTYAMYKTRWNQSLKTVLVYGTYFIWCIFRHFIRFSNFDTRQTLYCFLLELGNCLCQHVDCIPPKNASVLNSFSRSNFLIFGAYLQISQT